MSLPLNFHLAQYEGPLDLLLDLIRKQQIKISDIPIAQITGQYMDYMQKALELDIELSSDFVYMAATLIHIKSKMLLPRDPELEKMSPEEDPRQELVERLMEHERFKNAAEMLQQKRVIEDATWSNPQIDQFLSEDEGPGLAVTIFDLVKTLQGVLDRAKSRPIYEIGKEMVSVPDMIQFLRRELSRSRQSGPLSATQLFESQRSRRAMICLFLAILELVKRQSVALTQGEAFGDIGLERASTFEEDEALTPADLETVRTGLPLIETMEEVQEKEIVEVHASNDPPIPVKEPETEDLPPLQEPDIDEDEPERNPDFEDTPMGDPPPDEHIELAHAELAHTPEVLPAEDQHEIDDVDTDHILIEAVTQPAAPTPDNRDALKAVIEAAIYITDEPLSAEQIATSVEQPLERVKEILAELVANYAAPDRGLTIREIAGGYKMATKPEHHEPIRRFVKKLQSPMKLSLPALETLAVIAYRQPITGPEVLDVRGVQGAGVLKTLLDRKLIAAAGRKNVLGKPMMYKTTREFLIQFGLNSLAELPTLKEFEELGRMALAEGEELAAAVEEKKLQLPAQQTLAIEEAESKLPESKVTDG